jgi:hypothetical protein
LDGVDRELRRRTKQCEEKQCEEKKCKEKKCKDWISPDTENRAMIGRRRR